MRELLPVLCLAVAIPAANAGDDWLPIMAKDLGAFKAPHGEWRQVGDVTLDAMNPRKLVGLQGYGLSVSEAVTLEIPASDHTRRYLKTKKDKLGHKLSSV